MKTREYGAGKRMGRASAGLLDSLPQGGRAVSRETVAQTLSAQTATTTIRRLGYIALRVYEVVMDDLIRNDSPAAEEFADEVKPIVDRLIHFAFNYGGDEDTETDHDVPTEEV